MTRAHPNICPASPHPCLGYICAEERMCRRLHHRPLDLLLLADYVPITHFVGFRGEEYHSAVRVFGLPDVIHRTWDQRAQREIAPLDTVVFARYHDQPPSPYNYDDSNEDDDPAAAERSGAR